MKKIYILHGWTYTLKAWEKAVGLLSLAGFEPVLLKVPGLTAPTNQPWTIDGYVDWLSEELPTEPVILVGHSNGGRIALAFSVKNPGRVSDLILVDAAGIPRNELPIRLKRAVFGKIANLGKHMTSSALLRKIFYKIIRAKDYGRAPENMRVTMANMLAADQSGGLSEISARTLIIWGEKDKATPMSDARIMNEGIQGSKLVIIPQAAHSPHESHAERLVDEIKAFLS